jgi:hypothetical protein
MNIWNSSNWSLYGALKLALSFLLRDANITTHMIYLTRILPGAFVLSIQLPIYIFHRMWLKLISLIERVHESFYDFKPIHLTCSSRKCTVYSEAPGLIMNSKSTMYFRNTTCASVSIRPGHGLSTFVHFVEPIRFPSRYPFSPFIPNIALHYSTSVGSLHANFLCNYTRYSCGFL